MVRVLGPLAAIASWLGWLTLGPALGFPILGPAAMLNRVLVPRADPGYWLGWALVLIGLAAAALLYVALADRGRLRPGLVSGAAYGAVGWLVAGAVVMPLLGLADPTPVAPPPAPPDLMHGSLMMLHLGLGAPIAALVAWLLFGATLGATASPWPGDPSVGPRQTLRAPLFGVALAFATVLAIVLVVVRPGVASLSASATGTRTVLSGPAEGLPKGADFLSILEFAQAPGGTFGPHSHSASGFAYGLKGVATITFAASETQRVVPGEGGNVASQAVHTHRNDDGGVPSAALALAIVALAVAVCLICLRAARRDGRLTSVALALLIGAGALGIANPWSNDWLFFSVRGVAARGAPMPMPTATRVYESPDIGALLLGPYVQTLEEITIAPGEVFADVGSAGAALLFAIDGRVDVRSAGGAAIRIEARASTLLQPGAAATVGNAGDRPVHVLKFSVTKAPQS